MSISISFLVGAIWQVAIHQDVGAWRDSPREQWLQVSGSGGTRNVEHSCEENLTVPQEPGFTSQLTAGFKTFKLGQLLRNILFARVTKDKRNSWQLLNQRKLILVCTRFTAAPLHYSVLCPMYQSRKFCQCHSEIIIK